MGSRTVERGDIDPKLLKVSPNNVRTIEREKRISELSMSILSEGVRQPVIINTNNEVVAGQRRWLAALKANHPSIPFIRREYDSDIDEMIESLMENEHQEPLSIEEKGLAVKKLRDQGLTFEELSERTGIPESTLFNYARKVTMPSMIEAEEKTKVLARQMSIRKRNILDPLLKYKPFRDDPVARFELYSVGDQIPLHDAEQFAKELKRGLPVKIKKRLEIAKARNDRGDPASELVTWRILKENLKPAEDRCKRQSKDLQMVVNNLLKLWGTYAIDDTLLEDQDQA